MTLIVARWSTLEMLQDDSLDSPDLRYSAANKIRPAWGGLLGFAGTAGAVSRAIRGLHTHDNLGSFAEGLYEICKGNEEAAVEVLWLAPAQGLWVADSSGACDRLDTDWAVIGSGAVGASHIMQYTSGEAELLDVLETVSTLVPSVSPTGKIERVV